MPCFMCVYICVLVVTYVDMQNNCIALMRRTTLCNDTARSTRFFVNKLHVISES